MDDDMETTPTDDDSDEEDDEEFTALLNSFVSEVVTLVALDDLDDETSNRFGIPNIRRQRIAVETIFSRLGERLFKRCYRMSESLFWKLHDLLKPYLIKEQRLRGSTPNGDIATEARLSMSIRWFAGGDPVDIFQVHGVHYVEVYKSVWLVVDAINQCPELQIHFPTDYEEQHRIAKGFETKWMCVHSRHSWNIA